MFEEELELENKSSGFGPLLFIIALAALIISGIGYFVYEFKVKKDLNAAQATVLLTKYYEEKSPTTVTFTVGPVTATAMDKPQDPHYRLLVKAGLITMKGPKNGVWDVALTAEGEALIKSFPEHLVLKDPHEDKSLGYSIPLAFRKLGQVTRVTMEGRDRAMIDFTWKWEPTKLGNMFDASGPLVKGFSTWDRATLIEKYGASFYSADPSRGTLAAARGENGWEIKTED